MGETTLPGSKEILRRLAGAERILWFLDFDGTLVPIVRRPEAVVFEEAGRDALRRLSRQRRNEVAIVSGRPLAFVRRLVRLRSPIYAGNHGLEIKGPGIDFRHPGGEAGRPALLRVKRRWVRLSPDFPGSIVEDKGMTVTFHYRMVTPRRREEARLLARKAAGEASRGEETRLTVGKMIVEARPHVKWGKGEALKMLLEHWGYRPGRDLPAVFGDDETDRDMFRVVKKDGLAGFVGRGKAPPEANARLTGPAAVTRLLEGAAVFST